MPVGIKTMITSQEIDTGEMSDKVDLIGDDKTTEIGDAESDGDECAVIAPSAKTPRIASKEYVYDPTKLTLKFIFANRDGVNVVLECKPSDTVGEVKGVLLSMWPQAMPVCSGGDKIRLICMGKGMLSPDTKTLSAADVPVFKTHPTPVNVAVRPENVDIGGKKGNPTKINAGASGLGVSSADRAGARGPETASSGCSCVIS